MGGDSLSHSPSTPRKTPGRLILPPKDDPWSPTQKKSAQTTPKKRSKDALCNSTDEDDDEINWSEDEADQDGATKHTVQASKMPNKFKPKLKTPSPVKKQKKEQSDEDEPLGSPSKRAPAQKWTAEEELQLSRAIHKIALENASAIRDRAGLKNRTANQIGMKLKGEFRKRDKELGGDGKWLDAQIKKST